MNVRQLLRDAAVVAASGFVGTKVMEPVAMKLYEMEPDAARRQEDEARPGPPYTIAAKKTTEIVGLDLSERQVRTLGKVGFHYGLGIGWAPVYLLLRRKAGMTPLGAGLATGAAMSLLVDEGMTPLLGFSAPNQAYPLVTHLRGFVAHLAYGLGVAATTELLARLFSCEETE